MGYTRGTNFDLSVLSQKEKSDNSDNSEDADNNDYDNIGNIYQLAAMFANQDINSNGADINSIYAKKSVDKYYYEKPSPQNLLYEENGFSQNSYSGRSIYEWNIDGLNDKQIVDVTQKLLIYSTICKQQGNSDSAIAVIITTKERNLLKLKLLLVVVPLLLIVQEKKMQFIHCVYLFYKIMLELVFL
jgi:hypothetical protein